MRGRQEEQEIGRLHRKELLQFAHDLRNLILPILASAELLLESEKLSPQQKARLETIVRQIDRVERLVEDALWLGHESGSHHPVSIRSLVRQVVERVTTDSKIQVRCLFVTEDTLYVAGSESRLWRALYNLVLNAADAIGESGHVIVRVSLDESADRVSIEVEDTGPGIPPDIVENIFSRFFTTKKSHPGLGLSLAKEVIEDHRGTISVESQIDKGTTFFVRLPLLSK